MSQPGKAAVAERNQVAGWGSLWRRCWMPGKHKNRNKEIVKQAA